MKSLEPLRFALKTFEEFPEEVKRDPYYHGMFGTLTVILADFMGRDYQIVPSSDEREELSNGTWPGMLGFLNRSEADIALNFFMMTPQKWEVFAFLHPIEFGEVTFATNQPTLSANPTAVFQPFSTIVWFLFVVSMLAMAMTFLYIFKNRTFSDSVFSVWATVLRQPPSFNPKTYPERTVMGSWLFGMTIMTAAYMGLLLSYLTFPNLRGVKNILELSNAIEKGDYQCFFLDDLLKDFLLNSSIKPHRIIGKNLIRGRLPLDVNNAAYIELRYTFYLQYPKLFVAEDSFLTCMFAFVIRKDLRFKDKLNWAIIRLIETGIYDKLIRDAYLVKRDLDDAHLTRKLTLLDFKSAFIILLVGFGFSFFILLLEILAYKLEHLEKKVKVVKTRKDKKVLKPVTSKRLINKDDIIISHL